MSASKKVELTKLQPQQLLELQQDLQSELEHFQTSAQALAKAKQTFQDCIENIKQISSSENEQEILVPLSASLYVPGKVEENNKFMVDIGTGYYVEKNTDNSKKFYEGRIAKLNNNSEQINKIIGEKYELLQKVQSALQIKVQEQQQLQQLQLPLQPQPL